jgi:hypothetical protein
MRRFTSLLHSCAFPPHRSTAGPRNRACRTITLALDARETPRKLLHARETLTVTPAR